jgi:hypothetical protein
MEMLQSAVQFFDGPAKVWHLFAFVGIPLAITLSNMQKQIAAVAKGVIAILNRVDPENDW